MKLSLLVLFLVVVSIPAIAMSAPDCSTGASSQLCNALPSLGGVAVNDVPSFIAAAMTWLATVIGTLALVMVIFSGAQMVFSQGDPAALTKAKQSFTYSIIGLAVVMAAYVIVEVALNLMGADDNLKPGFIGVDPGGSFINPLRDTHLMVFIDSTARDFLTIIGAIAMLYIIISAFRYITARGNEEQSKKARATFTWAVVGLISIIMSYVIITVVLNALIIR
jgi:heme O synthase-like polyprenyltransferase